MFKHALVSVSDKTGLLEFLTPFAKKGMKIVSTGGTAEYLKKNGLNVISITEITQFPEVMGGRVKTLHPHVHMSLLSREGVIDDDELLKKYHLEIFDLVVVNLYPFEKALGQNSSEDELIEKIDIGGPSMLRSASKNFSRIAVVCDPSDYKWILEKKELSIEDRKKLAGKVFKHTSSYDHLIGQTLAPEESSLFTLAGRKHLDLRYGENPQQQAFWYQSLGNAAGLHQAQILNGKTLSFNNLLDLDASVKALKLFSEPTVVAVKHNNPCGIGSGENLFEATKKALQADPISVFGGVVACNQKVDLESAKKFSEIFLECLVAPDFDSDAFEVLAQKKNLRILEWSHLSEAKTHFEIKEILGGFLVQTPNQTMNQKSQWKFFGDQPNEEVLKDLYFAEKVVSSLKSNAIAVIENQQTLGLGMGQVNRVDAVLQALERMIKNHQKLVQPVLASDAFFPFADSIEIIAQFGVKWVLQPGGSIKDNEVIEAAKKNGIQMVFTGTRHFKH